MAQVKIIAPQTREAEHLRVAAYCRVSTEEEEQQGSFEIQKLYYTEKINSTPEWEVAASTQMTVSPAYIPRSVTVLTR